MRAVTSFVNRFQILDGLPLFAGLTGSRKKRIAPECEILEYAKGELIYREGGSPDYFYCLASGRVELYHPSSRTKDRRETAVECARKGDYFGSISALTGRPHSVSARVLNDAVVLRIAARRFNRLLRAIPELGVTLTHSLSRRLHPRGPKEIFQTTVISVYGVACRRQASLYARALLRQLRRQSRRKSFLLSSRSLADRKAVAPAISELVGVYAYVVIDGSAAAGEIAMEILKQSDCAHILSASDRDSLRTSGALAKKLRKISGAPERQRVSILVNEDAQYRRTSYAVKTELLSGSIYGSLPADPVSYARALRRIARQTAGVSVGLALGSGSAMGFAHIGVLKVLEQEKIPVDMIAGTSIGALIAALWAAGYSAPRIQKIVSQFSSKLKTLSLVDPALIPVRGLVHGNAVRRILNSYLGRRTFADLRMPLKIVACDIRNRQEVVLDRGNLVDAVMASIAIPGVFEPVEWSGNCGDGSIFSKKIEPSPQLVDGGIINPLPVSVLSRRGVKRIIAVNTLPSPEDIVRLTPKRLNIYGILVNSFQAMEYTMASYSKQQADVYLHPIPALADWYEFYKARRFIQTGARHARSKLAQIRKLLKP